MDAETLTRPRLEITGLVKTFGGQPVLNGVNLALAHGEVLAVIGRSGCGKSTLLKCINLILKPDNGQIALDGDFYFHSHTLLYAAWEVRRNIAMVFQEFNLFPNYTVRGNIKLALKKNFAMPDQEANHIAERVAVSLKIADVLARYPHEISGGQAQRCALARAIVLRPKVFLLDEITSALDPLAIIDVIDAIRSLRDTALGQEMSVILVTHFMHFAETFADRIAFFHDGRIHEEHPAARFFSAASKQETLEFISAHREAR